MSDVNLAHPGAEQLAAYQARRLGAEEAASVAAHLAGCEVCRRLLEARDADTEGAQVVAAAPTITGEVPAAAPAGNADATTVDGTAPAAKAGPAMPPALAGHPRYRVLDLLGTGGMGAVYKAEHRLMERLVALKVINHSLVGDAAAVERFRLEVKAAARVAHPHIVTAYDAEQAGDTHFLVMEFVEGTSLAEVVEVRGALPVAYACEYIRQAALGLQHAFEQGMVHRDIKPHNLMLTPRGKVKILDFGLARFARETGQHAQLTAAGVVMGTPDFIAPEQATDPRKADIRADVYSLGCTLYYLLTARPPFPNGTAIQKVMAHLEEAPKSVHSYRNDVPPELARVLGRMMAKDPAKRFATPVEVARALVPFVRSATVTDREREPSAGRRGATVADARPASAKKVSVELADSSATELSPPAPPRAERGRRPRRDVRRQRGAILAAVAAVVLLGAALLSVAVYRIATDRGEIVIKTDDPDVKVVVSQEGRTITILDGKTDQAVTLKSGSYGLALDGAPRGLQLSTDTFTLKRGDKQIVEVRRIPPEPERAVRASGAAASAGAQAAPASGRPGTAPLGAAEAPVGQVAIDADDPTARLVFRLNGRVVMDATRERLVNLPPGTYEVALAEPRPDLRLSAERVTTEAGKRVSLAVQALPLAWPPAALRGGQIRAPDLSRTSVLFEADFTNPKSGFPIGSGPLDVHGYAGGKWFIRRTARGGVRDLCLSGRALP
jgi:predicted Ser/Thr protein kinase